MKKSKTSKNKTIRIILTIVFVAFIIAAGISTYKVISIYREYAKGVNEYDALEEYVEVTEEIETPNEPEEVKTVSEETPAPEAAKESKIKINLDIDTQSLKDINPDFIGWIYYEPLEISYPIVMDRGDEYYEHYSFEQERSASGAIFLDYVCKPNFTAFNSIVYGHNMKNGTMFGSLNELLKDTSTIEENPYFYIFTDKEIFMYQIFAGYYASAKSNTYVMLQIDYSMEDKQKYLEYIDSVAEYRNEDALSMASLDDDTMLCTLSTCHGVNSGNRTVIHGVLVAREAR